jgi:hypothetical protein
MQIFANVVWLGYADLRGEQNPSELLLLKTHLHTFFATEVPENNSLCRGNGQLQLHGALAE